MSTNGNDFAPDYVDVATRISEFREKYPHGRLRPADPSQPYRIEYIGDEIYVVVVAAAYRDQDDTLPGIGMAYEPWPGRTPYTRRSELQNAETSAWGRAIVATLVADARKSIASAEEVRNRQMEPLVKLKKEIWAEADRRGWIDGSNYQALSDSYTEWSGGDDITTADEEHLEAYLAHLQQTRPKRTMKRGES